MSFKRSSTVDHHKIPTWSLWHCYCIQLTLCVCGGRREEGVCVFVVGGGCVCVRWEEDVCVRDGRKVCV